MVFMMQYKRNNKKFSVKGRGEYMSKADFFEKYYFNIENCRQFFFDIKWPNGYFCEKCGHTYYYFMKTKNCYRCSHCGHDERLLSHTIFQDNKLPYNVLLYGLFLVFTDKRQLSSLELAEELKVNYKTACLLHNKCRILMKNSNLDHTLDSSFYESDVAYTGTPAKQGKRGMGTDKQPFLIVLSTGRENEYPKYIKMQEIEKDRSDLIEGFFDKNVKMSEDRKLNTDGKTTYNILKSKLEVLNEKIDYKDDNHRLYFLNKIVSNFNSALNNVYHGIGKRMLPLYYSEYEWRFNHRNSKDILDKISKYIQKSSVCTRKMITNALNLYALKRGLIIS